MNKIHKILKKCIVWNGRFYIMINFIIYSLNDYRYTCIEIKWQKKVTTFIQTESQGNYVDVYVVKYKL